MQSRVITNDRGARLARKDFLASQVNLALSEKPEMQDPVQIDVVLPGNYDTLTAQELFGTLKGQKLTPEQANDVMSILRGYPTKTGFSFNIIGIKDKTVSKPTSPVVLAREIDADVPANFRELRAKDLYYYLTTKSHLAPELANDLIDVLNGKPPITKNLSFNVNFVEDAIVEVEPVDEAPAFTSAVPRVQLEVQLPENYDSMSAPELFSYLRDTVKLPFEQADDVVSILNGFAPRSKGIDFSILGVKQPEVQAPVEDKPTVPTMDVELPVGYEKLSASSLYTWFTKVSQLTPDQANDAIDVLAGRPSASAFRFIEQEG